MYVNYFFTKQKWVCGRREAKGSGNPRTERDPLRERGKEVALEAVAVNEQSPRQRRPRKGIPGGRTSVDKRQVAGNATHGQGAVMNLGWGMKWTKGRS